MKVRWSRDQVNKIERELKKCSCIKDIQKREIIISKLPDIFQENMNRGQNLSVDTFHIVDTCSRYPGGIENLLDCVYDFEGDSSTMISLLPYILDPIGILDEAHWKNLLQILFRESKGPNEILKAYKKTFPFEVRLEKRLPDPENALWFEVVRDVLKLFSDEFEKYSIVSIFREVGNNLRNSPYYNIFIEIIEKIADCLGQPEISPTESNLDDSTCYLLIDLKKNSVKKNEFSARFHIARGTNQIPCIDEMQNTTEKEIERKLDQYLSQANWLGQKVQIELFLRPEHFNEMRPETWWLRKKRNFPIQLGREFPAVIRLSRDVSKQIKVGWESRWNLLKNLKFNSEINDEYVRLLSKNEIENPEELFEALIGNQTQVIVIAPFQPAVSSYGKPNLAHVIIDAGIPAAIWGNSKKEDIKGLLRQMTIADFPEALCQKRREDKKGFPNFITLMWDDPGRIWDEEAAQAPPEGKDYPFQYQML